jgi:hypothetical protein
MLASARYLVSGNPTHCTFCKKRLPSRDGFVEFWRNSDGKHFCSEFCADDAEEANFQMHHVLPVASNLSKAGVTRL